MTPKVAVVGASGFVGAAVVERLLDSGKADVLPLIHTSGNAWQLARRGITLKTVDLLDAHAIGEALNGCTHVVNCSRGSDETMLRGLKNLVVASRTAKVRRFVHLSSVMVYGDPPPAEATCEDAPTRPRKGSYGHIKLMQDEMVRKATSEGLASVILCPPNISGPHSYFLLGVLAALSDGSLVLAGDGESPCALVDVENLAYAVQIALDSGVSDGRRFFITDDGDLTWRQLVISLAPLTEKRCETRSVSKEWLGDAWSRTNAKPRLNPFRSIAHLASGEVRQALRRDPLWCEVDTFTRALVGKLGNAVEERMRLAIAGPIPVDKVSDELPINIALSAQQLRGVRHSSARAQRDLGYRPIRDFQESMRVFSEWHRHAQGLDGKFADLIRHLG